MPHQRFDFTTQIFCECVSNELKYCHQCNKTASSWEAILNQRPDSSVPVLSSVPHIPNGPSKLILRSIWGKIRMHHMCLQTSNALAKHTHTLLALLRMTYIDIHKCTTFTFKLYLDHMTFKADDLANQESLQYFRCWRKTSSAIMCP